MRQQLEFATTGLGTIAFATAVWLGAASPTDAGSPSPLQVGSASKVIHARIGDWVQGAGLARFDDEDLTRVTDPGTMLDRILVPARVAANRSIKARCLQMESE